jgi:5-methyltetrahydropteroyltriglutamate--homocysteine methyltransferase
VDASTNFFEHTELVAQRIRKFVENQIIAGSDCGFGTFAGFGAVDPEIAYAKLGSLAQGAVLASQ